MYNTDYNLDFPMALNEKLRSGEIEQHSDLYNQTQEEWRNKIGKIGAEIVEKSLSGFSILSKKNELLLCNPAQLKMLGFNPESGMPDQLRNTNVIDFVPPELKEEATSLVDQLTNGKAKEMHYTFTTVSVNGEKIPIHIHAYLLEKPENGEDIIITEIQDLRQHNELTETLKKEQKRNEQILDCVQAGIVTYVPFFNEKGEIVDWEYSSWNPYMEKMTDLQAEEVIENTLSSAFSHIKDAGIDRILEKAFRENITGIVFDIPFDVNRKKGFFDGIYAPLINKEGETTGVIASIIDVTQRTKLYQQLKEANQIIIEGYQDTIEAIVALLEFREQETAEHSKHVAEISQKFARRLMPEINNEDEKIIYWGALLHDIGKIGIPDAILLKRGPLTEEEWEIMKSHSILAEQTLSKIPFLRKLISPKNFSIKDIPECHHEHWNGKGYPKGLKEEEIPYIARMFAIVDGFSALRQNRPYRPAFSLEQTKETLEKEAGIKYDPELDKEFIKMIEEGIIN